MRVVTTAVPPGGVVVVRWWGKLVTTVSLTVDPADYSSPILSDPKGDVVPVVPAVGADPIMVNNVRTVQTGSFFEIFSLYTRCVL